MPYSLGVDPASRLVVATFTGDVTGAEILASFTELHAHLNEHPGEVGTIWDMRGATSLSIMRDDVGRIATAMQRTGEIAPVRGAIVVSTQQTTISGLVKLLLGEGASESRPQRAFTEVEEALRWVTERP